MEESESQQKPTLSPDKTANYNQHNLTRRDFIKAGVVTLVGSGIIFTMWESTLKAFEARVRANQERVRKIREQEREQVTDVPTTTTQSPETSSQIEGVWKENNQNDHPQQGKR